MGDMMKVHEIATKHLDIFGHPEDEPDSANAMRALFGLEEEETERSMLGGKGFKGMLGSKTAYLSRSALPKDVDNPKKLRTLSSRMQNAFNELLDKHCVTNELDNGGEMVKPRIEGPKIRMEASMRILGPSMRGFTISPPLSSSLVTQCLSSNSLKAFCMREESVRSFLGLSTSFGRADRDRYAVLLPNIPLKPLPPNMLRSVSSSSRPNSARIAFAESDSSSGCPC